jgi:GNAT superfamily N-acetyltransferase
MLDVRIEDNMEQSPVIEIHPLTHERWQDFENLFGPRGACGGCWCMFWKLPRKDFLINRGEGNRSLQKAIVDMDEIPGILAIVDGIPVGWCAVEPRENYPGLGRSRILKSVDDAKVWSISCFYVDRKYRFMGISTELLAAAVRYAAEHGANIVEGYPTDTQDAKMPAPFVYTGLASGFIKAGFVEVARRSTKRPIMRYYIRS